MAYRLSPNAPIGIFDSGPGGLAVLQEVRRLLPNEDVLYIGDTARQPYGPRPVEEVEQFAVELTGYLAEQGAKVVLIGCNTATVAGWAKASRLYPEIPVIGMIQPGVRAALAKSAGGRIGVWGTELTVASRAYDTALLTRKPDATVIGVAPSALLRLAEKGQIEDEVYLKQLSDESFAPLSDAGVDTLILGCTDLTCVRPIIERSADGSVTIVDPAEEVVVEAQQVLADTNALREPRQTPPSYRFQITGTNVAEFAAFTASFLGLPSVDVEQVELREVL